MKSMIGGVRADISALMYDWEAEILNKSVGVGGKMLDKYQGWNTVQLAWGGGQHRCNIFCFSRK